MGQSELAAAVGPGVAAITVAVVGQDPLDGDALGGEPGDGPSEERDGVCGVLRAGELAVGEPRVGIDGGMDVGVAAAGSATSLGLGCPSQHLVATAGRHPGKLLHVDVDQLAAAVSLDVADRPPSGAVHPAQPGDAMTNQDPVHGGGRHPHNAPKTGWTELARTSQRHNAPLQPGRGPMRAAVGPARAVLQPSDALRLIAPPPLVGALTGDVHRFCRRGDGPPIQDPQTQPQPAFGSEWSVTVHCGLLGPCVAFDSSTLAQEATHSADVTNVPGHNT